MSRILLTGANSFVGSNFVKFSENKEIDEISLFINKPEDIDFTGYDVVIHLVAIVHQSKKINEGEYMRVNRDLCLRVARKAKMDGIRHFIFLSTIKVYGKFYPGSGPWTETSDCFPEDSYGKSKYEAEQSLIKIADDKFTVSIIRTPLVYGEGVHANMQGLIKLISKFPILPFGGVENKRNFTSVENLTAFIDRIIITKRTGVFIAMDEKALSTTELVRLISKSLDSRVILFRIPRFIIQICIRMAPTIFERLYDSFEIDNSKTLQELDFHPPFSTEYCINKMSKGSIAQKSIK